MLDEHTSLLATVMGRPQSEAPSMSSHRLDTAREQIDAVCAEYNHFNPSCFVAEPSPSTISCAGTEHERRFRPPSPDQLRSDLQVLFERFLALESVEADNAYRRISLHAWETASNEYDSFDWEKLKEIIGAEVEELSERGCYLDVSDLATLRAMTVLY